MQNWLFGFVFSLVAVSGLANNTEEIPECVANRDCPSDRVCTEQKCVNPCAGVCGPRTVCHVTNHVAMCSCNPGHSGHPILGCSANPDLLGYSGCSSHDQCPASKACIQGMCRNPCDDLCGENTTCTIRYHVPACACKEGLTGNPFLGCSPQVTKETLPLTSRGMKKFYVENSKRATWQEALLNCLRKNCRLASIDNVEELDQIRQLIRLTGRRFGRFWTSGSDIGYEGNYIWASTGKTLSPSSDLWLQNPAQPDNFQYQEHCVELWERFDYQGYGLNDRQCMDSINYICEYYS